MRARTGLLLFLFLARATAVPAAPLRYLPYNDPIYPFLEKAYALGWVRYLPQVRPYTQAQALIFLDEIDK